ncbi:SymE family type I addiction module toxin [Paenibacillaceae bacterium WGS1546]|uniref:SymE family type I addiction module toxin n=1 Tax=Cohnella sp. WGS1546 TaxID=3366810 RepID=UPI00372D7D93
MDKKKRILTVSSAFVNNQQIPQIRIQGKWLNDLGFSIRSRVEVEVMHGELRIAILNDDKFNESNQ